MAQPQVLLQCPHKRGKQGKVLGSLIVAGTESDQASSGQGHKLYSNGEWKTMPDQAEVFCAHEAHRGTQGSSVTS